MKPPTESVASQIESNYLNYVGGEWAEASSHETFKTFDPANGEMVSTCQSSSPNDVRNAIDVARKAFDTTPWSVDVQYRTSILIKLSRYLALQDMKGPATILTRECGKPYRYNLSEYTGISQVFENTAGNARFLMGQFSNPKVDAVDIGTKEPVGVVGIIVPWNAPVNLLGRTLAPALAAGCTVVIKPASATAGSTMEFVRMVNRFTEIPKGVINCVTGSGAVAGAELARNSDVDMISFTGDVSTGKEIMGLAASNVKKMALELGGKSPNVVLPDADMEKASRDSVTSACFYHAGQICFASTRILVDRSVHDRFIQAFVSTVSKMPIGHGLDPQSEIGPVITKSQLERVLGYIENGKRDSRLIMGGERLTSGPYAKGNFVKPTLFDEVPIDSKIAQDEIFGPVVTVTEFDNVDEAIELANRTRYGLSSVLWTGNLSAAFKLAKGIRAGMVWVNTPGRGSSYFNSFGIGGSPYKESGLGSMGTVDGYTLGKRIHMELP